MTTVKTMPLTQAQDFLLAYEQDAQELQQLIVDYRTILTTDPVNVSGSPDGGYKAYARQNNQRLTAHEKIQKKISGMQNKYQQQFAIDPPSELGDIRVLGAYLKKVEGVKRNAIMAVEDAVQQGTPITPNIANALDYAKSTGGAKSSYPFDMQKKYQQDALHLAYDNMWVNTYQCDLLYTGRKHKEALKGRGHYSRYSINVRAGYNIQFGEWDTERLGVRNEHGYFDRYYHDNFWRKPYGSYPTFLIPRFTFSDMQRLGQFAIEEKSYTYEDEDGNSVPLVDSNGKAIYGPATELTIGSVSLHTGYGVAAKFFYETNDWARFQQAGHSIGAFLSSHVNNPAVLLDLAEEEKKIGLPPPEGITQKQFDALKDAHEEAKAQLKEFREDGIAIDSIAPGAHGVDFYYQMEAICNVMGIPFNKQGPTLEQILKEQIANSNVSHLKATMKYALHRVRKDETRNRQRAQENLEKAAKHTAEYKSLLNSVTIMHLKEQFQSFQNSAKPDEQRLYAKFIAFESMFKRSLLLSNARDKIFDKNGNIINKELYDIKYAQAFAKDFKDDFKQMKKFVETDPAMKKALIKNAVGAHFTGREDWYRAQDDDSRVTADIKNNPTPGQVTADTQGQSKPIAPIAFVRGSPVGAGGPGGVAIAGGHPYNLVIKSNNPANPSGVLRISTGTIPGLTHIDPEDPDAGYLRLMDDQGAGNLFLRTARDEPPVETPIVDDEPFEVHVNLGATTGPGLIENEAAKKAAANMRASQKRAREGVAPPEATAAKRIPAGSALPTKSTVITPPEAAGTPAGQAATGQPPRRNPNHSSGGTPTK